jgi:centrosomal protein CEP290
MACFKIASLQKALEDSIPLSELDRTNKKLHEITEKYRDHKSLHFLQNAACLAEKQQIPIS